MTVPKIDPIIETTLDAGAKGAKINGSGGEGTIGALAPEREEEVCEAIRETGASAFRVEVDEGDKILD